MTTVKASLPSFVPDSEPQDPFEAEDYVLARHLMPNLYWQVTSGYVSFLHIAMARRMRTNPAKPPSEERKRASRVLEYLAKRRFSQMHDDIHEEYWCKQAYAGCALTGDGELHSAIYTNDAELVLYEDGIHQLCRDTRRAFQGSRRAGELAQEVDEVGETLFAVLSRVACTAEVLQDEDASALQKDEALATVRLEWQAARNRVEALIQRQARFEYFVGVAGGGVAVALLLVVSGLLLGGLSTDLVDLTALTAAMVAGALGAVVSVAQRMTSNSLVLDFTAPKRQKVLLGAVRPLVGAVFAAVVYFAFYGGLLAVGVAQDETAKAFAFYVVAGFAAGFSERFATDVLERAGASMVTTAREEPASSAEVPALLLTQQTRRAPGSSNSQDEEGR